MQEETSGEEPDEVAEWVRGLAAGRPESSEEIWRAYYDKLTRYARHKLAGHPRRDLDEEDVALSAMNSFYRGAAEGRFPKLDDRDDLWKLLLTITARKAQKKIRWGMAAKRGGGEVRGESVFAARGDGLGLADVLGTEPSEALSVGVAGSCGELLAKLDDDSLREIAIARLEGYSNEEIAERLDCAVRTVERKLKRIRTLWSREHAATADTGAEKS
ncbi:MAG: ECF-type sigma factor [Planctomycetota bacterium]